MLRHSPYSPHLADLARYILATFSWSSFGPNENPNTKFKLLLQPATAHHGSSHPDMDPVNLVAEYLRPLHVFIMETLQSKYGSTLQNEEIAWVFIVPGKLHQRLKRRRPHFRRDLERFSEGQLAQRRGHRSPDAAALYCLKKIDEWKPKSKDVFMTVDAGGGTVDLVVHRVSGSGSNMTLREVAAGTGDACGAIFLDEAFLTAEEKVGAEELELL
ncbi:hypothetical protein BDK51DRAFT_49595 [Blyttiomyces helicus]|uniref:Hsp70 protein-domain-containing protein n=1 Tax=Blyttiomyces helicus TaxID=388810 RepID=A0A4P9WKT3_9FUNG|nr:hypothetical protein BDK51DRAFT_49595 [Blyttiomyces helicus]|eukprot:RKO91790.1 hypothetical protein BDK51DRAFT_49595 [Blyttiomyces helicus]